MTCKLAIATLLVNLVAGCAASVAPSLPPTSPVAPTLVTESVAATPSLPPSPAPHASSEPLVANGPIYFTDGNMNRVADGVLSVMDDLVTVDVEWSPDGSEFLRVGGASAGPIYRSDADGTGTVEVTQGYHRDWSPDGASIVFQRETPGSKTSESDIFVIRADGSDERRLTTSPEFREVWPSWSPDGARILYSRWATDGTENSPGYNPEVVTIDVTTAEINVIGEGEEPVYSPDGTLIAIEECFGVVVIDAATHVERFLDPSAACYPPAWSPDGTQLAYANDDHISITDVSSGDVRALPAFPDALFVMRLV